MASSAPKKEKAHPHKRTKRESRLGPVPRGSSSTYPIGIFEGISSHLVLRVLHYADGHSLAKFSVTCRGARAVSRNEKLWEELCIVSFGWHMADKEVSETWQALYARVIGGDPMIWAIGGCEAHAPAEYFSAPRKPPASESKNRHRLSEAQIAAYITLDTEDWSERMMNGLESKNASESKDPPEGTTSSSEPTEPTGTSGATILLAQAEPMELSEPTEFWDPTTTTEPTESSGPTTELTEPTTEPTEPVTDHRVLLQRFVEYVSQMDPEEYAQHCGVVLPNVTGPEGAMGGLFAEGLSANLLQPSGVMAIVGGWVHALQRARLQGLYYEPKIEQNALVFKGHVPNMETRRCYHAATTIQDRLMVVGGSETPYAGLGDVYDTCEVLHPATNLEDSSRWTPGPRLSTLRTGHALAHHKKQGIICAVGGYGGDSIFHQTFETLHVSASGCDGKWVMDARKMKYPRTGVGCGFGPDGCVYAIGGSSNGSTMLDTCERIDLRDPRGWQPLPPMNENRGSNLSPDIRGINSLN
uniref:F-box domain-containing protein n=1 Tax=Lotharella globosa TaxID=91324 RepID=A0A7S3YX41_9EUKA